MPTPISNLAFISHYSSYPKQNFLIERPHLERGLHEVMSISPVKKSLQKEIPFKQEQEILFCEKESTPLNEVFKDIIEEGWTIQRIQGPAHVSPFVDHEVQDVEGIVTLVVNKGFYMQAPGKTDVSQGSHGIFIYTGDGATVQVGDLVRVDGDVKEFGGRDGRHTVTEIVNPVIQIRKREQNLPDAIELGGQGLRVPTDVYRENFVGRIDREVLQPDVCAMDRFESLVGMRVCLKNARVVGPTKDGFVIVPDQDLLQRLVTPNGGVTVSRDTLNGHRLWVSAKHLIGDVDPVNVGAEFALIEGILKYNSFGTYEIQATKIEGLTPSTIERDVSRVARSEDHLTVGNFNLENLTGRSPQKRFDSLADLIVEHLLSPDMIMLEEIGDNNGEPSRGGVSASRTIERLIQAISTRGGCRYHSVTINPVADEDGGKPGLNIRNVILYNPRRVKFRRRGTAEPQTEALLENEKNPSLKENPARLDPENLAFRGSRKPLVAEFEFKGHQIFMIGTHLVSKQGDHRISGVFQPPRLKSQVKRLEQTTVIADFVKQILEKDRQAMVIVAGDMNEFHYHKPMRVLEAVGLSNLTYSLPENQRYTYNFDGNSQALDHILASARLMVDAEYEIVHVNADFHDAVSDHDVPLASFYLPKNQFYRNC